MKKTSIYRKQQRSKSKNGGKNKRFAFISGVEVAPMASNHFIPAIQRKCTACADDDKLHRKENSSGGFFAPASVSNYVQTLGNSGNKLSAASSQFFSSRLNYDFSNVKIHTDKEATGSAKAVNAHAYTIGDHIVFNEGKYQPETPEGKKLLAHELTHVIQQSTRLQPMVQREKKLEGDEATKCLQKIEEVIQALEKSVADPARKMPDYIKKSVEFLRKKKKEGKIGCYELDGSKEGRTDLDTGEIQIDSRHIDETHILHEGVHGQHQVEFPTTAKKYGTAVTGGHKIDTSKPLSEADKDLFRYKAWTEYWGYKSNYDYYNNARPTPMTEDEIHTLLMLNKDVKLPIMEVWKFDQDFDPRKYKPKN